MNTESFEQITFAKDLINAPDFLADGMMCFVLFHATENRALTVELPKTVTLKVTYAEPAVKGNTSTNAMKTVTVEGGAEVKVPLFIQTDEVIIINTEDGSYKERAK
jgi:elongation factor P